MRVRATKYHDYLARFRAACGDQPLARYTTFHGKLVRRLSADDFARKWRELGETVMLYEHIVRQGDTMNDALEAVLEERLAELLLIRRPQIPAVKDGSAA